MREARSVGSRYTVKGEGNARAQVGISNTTLRGKYVSWHSETSLRNKRVVTCNDAVCRHGSNDE